MDQEVRQLSHLQFGPPQEVVQLERKTLTQELQETEIFLKILASPVNPADLITITGKYAITPLLPCVPGNECVARVEKIGSAVRDLAVGDLVVPFRSGLGTWRSHGIFSASDWFRIPPSMDTVAAATLTVNPPTAYRMLRDFVALKPGDTVLQNGANSAVGQLVAQLCRKWGINCVGVVRARPDIDALKTKLKAGGATEIYTEEEFAKTEVFTDSLPAPKLALNCVGGESAENLLNDLAHGGYFVTYGCISRRDITIPSSVFIYRDIKCCGLWRTNWTRENHGNPERVRMLEEIVAMYQAGDLTAPDAEMIPIENFQTALGGVQGKKSVTIFRHSILPFNLTSNFLSAKKSTGKIGIRKKFSKKVRQECPNMAKMDYQDIYEEIIRILREGGTLEKISFDLHNMRKNKQPNSDKVDYVFELLQQNNLLPDAAEYEEVKSDAKSEEFRQVGNSVQQEYLFAVSKENLSIGLANRSAVFFEMGMFAECLESIRLARERGYPERLKEKLERREAKCHEELAKKPAKEEKFIPKIDLPVNEKIPFLARCLALRKDGAFGRHVITQENIPAGTIIAIEEAFCKILTDSGKYLRCSACLAEVPHLLLPCDGCTQTMFCSKACQEMASADYHPFECPISGSLFRILDDSLLIVFRTSICAFLAFPDVETMGPALEKIDREQKTVFSYDWTKKLSPEELYTPIHTLATNEYQRDGDYLFKKYLIACLMFNLLKRSSPVFSQRYLTTSMGENILKNVLFRHLLTGPTNMHSIGAIEDTSDPENSIEYGVAAYGFHSLMNHSCAPNVTRISLGSASGVVTIKNISRGEQILDNYGYHHSLMDRTARQRETLRKYAFVCQCTACIENFPLYGALPLPINIPQPLPLHNQTLACQYSREFGEKGYKKITGFIRKFGYLYPILQLCAAEEGLKFCLNILCENIPLQLREKIRLEFAKTEVFTDSLPAPKLALNCVGGESAENLLNDLAHGGYFVTYGCISRRDITIPSSVFIYRDIKCCGFWRTNWTRENHGNPERVRMLEEIVAMYQAGDLTAPDAEMIPIENFQTALGGVRQECPNMAKMDYQDIYEEIIRILREGGTLEKISFDLHNMRKNKQPNSDKVDYVFELLQQNNLLPDAAEYEEVKSDAKSEEFRQVGNSCFSLKSQKYIEALKAYNKSICFAVSKENLSIGLANRSAVFFEMGMFAECLESIRLARERGYPERLKEKLERREAKCHEELAKKPAKEEKFIPKIDLPVNEKIPFLARCLALRKDGAFGRHVITQENIPAGTIIAIEEAFCKILTDSGKYLRCSACLAEVPHLLLPCDGCTQTMFCSKACQEMASADYHPFECPISGSLFRILDDSLLIVFRTSICAFLAFPDVETMGPALEKIDREQKTVFSYDWTKKLSPEELYTPIHTLATNEYQRDGDYLFKKYLIACLMFNLLKRSSPVFSQRYLTTSMGENILKNVLFRHLLTGPTNMHSIGAIEDTSDPENSIEYGVAAYGFHSLMNHSCAPNVTRISLGSASGVVTIKNISRGEQILDNYGYHHSLMDRTARQRETLRKYAFVCQCTACIENFPLYGALPLPINIPEPLPLHNQTLACQYSREFGEKGYKKITGFIRKFGYLYPILQLCTAEEGLKFCLNILCENIPLQLREKIRLVSK
uniref:Putative zn2+-binding dehydrogenase nuclear receptor binding factor-1 n=1 Tax=Lutzomyia longipalpis TaxID=7200 RepID=A0A7G3B8L3_LUTLO